MKEYMLHLQKTTGQSLRIEYAKHLNKEQYEVVSQADGSALVLAGAGSGKTRTLIYRVAYLLEKGIDPQHVLLMTFTNKAAHQMISRVEQLLLCTPEGLLCGTFHHVANHLLRQFAEQIGYRNDFVILDEDDSLELIKSCLDLLNIHKIERRFPTAHIVQAIISFSRNAMIPLDDVVRKKYDYWTDSIDFIKKIARLYEEKKRTSLSMDYDDLLACWLYLLKQSQEAREYHHARFRYILVDEYQDTNCLQHNIICNLVHNDTHIFVVGDDAQSIYSFRAANVHNILDFPKSFPSTRIFKLQTNYRSTPQILQLANESIRNNKNQFHKTLHGVHEDGEKPAYVQVNNVYAQACFIAQRVLELREEGIPMHNIAVLFRARYQAAELELELAKRNIPYVLRGGVRFFEQAHIKDVVSFLRVFINVKDEIAWRRILQYIEGVGKATAEEIWSKIVSTSNSFDQVCNYQVSDTLSGRAKKGFQKMLHTIKPLIDLSMEGKNTPAEIIAYILQNGYREYVNAHFENANDRIEDLEQLTHFAARFSGVREFVADITLKEDFKGESIVSREKEDEFLVLSTIHQAKGLEWDVVFLLGMQEGSFPHPKSFDDVQQFEEERRLFYVAITRAKRALYVVHPLFRYDRNYGQVITRPSQFIREIDQNSFEVWRVTETEDPWKEKEIYI